MAAGRRKSRYNLNLDEINSDSGVIGRIGVPVALRREMVLVQLKYVGEVTYA